MGNLEAKAKKMGRLLIRDGNHCHWCLLAFTQKNQPTFEHLLPACRGGTNELDNLAPVHKACNR